jgi:hypothetical protein
VISVDGKRIGSCTIHDVCIIEFEIPRPLTFAGEPFEVALIIPRSRRPNEIKASLDDRVLGFCLEQVTVVNYADPREDSPVVLPAAVTSPESATP